MKKYTYFTILIVLVAFLGSCKDDEVNSVTPAINTQVTASIGGIVLDENGDGVSGATVTLGTTQITTSPYGVFLFKSVSMDSKRAFIKVNKAGYFLGSRVIKPNASTVSNVRIKLLRKTSAGSFSSSAGGTITSASGVELVFPANAIKVEGGGAYTGSVDVAVQFLDPNSDDIFDNMPGDLKGVDLDGEEMGLQTFGMAAIELTGSGGQKLNMADGSTASLKMPLSGDALSAAPASIPLWYFDEEQGIWKEEGSASLVGNEYVGEVAHFSFWNMDVAFVSAYISGKITCNGIPRQGVYVTARVGNGSYARAITAADGSFEGYVPDNEVITLEVASITCGSILLTETVGPFSSSSNTVIPTIDACGSSNAGTSQITGQLIDCNSNPVVNGGLRIYNGQTSSFVFSDANGNISTVVDNCGQDSFTFWAFDYGSELMGTPETYAANPSINIGSLSTCGEEIFYMDVVYNGEPNRTYILGRENEVAVAVNHAIGRSYIWGGKGALGDEDEGLYMFINGEGIGTFDVDSVWAIFSETNYGISNGPMTGVTVTITEHSPTIIDPDYHRIKGTFTGTFTDDEDGLPRTLEGSFNVPIAQ